MKVYKDDFGNTAFIETVETFPYNGAAKRENAFRLVLKADYDTERPLLKESKILEGL